MIYSVWCHIADVEERQNKVIQSLLLLFWLYIHILTIIVIKNSLTMHWTRMKKRSSWHQIILKCEFLHIYVCGREDKRWRACVFLCFLMNFLPATTLDCNSLAGSVTARRRVHKTWPKWRRQRSRRAAVAAAKPRQTRCAVRAPPRPKRRATAVCCRPATRTPQTTTARVVAAACVRNASARRVWPVSRMPTPSTRPPPPVTTTHRPLRATAACL